MAEKFGSQTVVLAHHRVEPSAVDPTQVTSRGGFDCYALTELPVEADDLAGKEQRQDLAATVVGMPLESQDARSDEPDIVTFCTARDRFAIGFPDFAMSCITTDHCPAERQSASHAAGISGDRFTDLDEASIDHLMRFDELLFHSVSLTVAGSHEGSDGTSVVAETGDYADDQNAPNQLPYA